MRTSPAPVSKLEGRNDGFVPLGGRCMCSLQRSNSSFKFSRRLLAAAIPSPPFSCLSLSASPRLFIALLSLPAAQGPLICLNAQQAPLAALKQLYPFVLSSHEIACFFGLSSPTYSV